MEILGYKVIGTGDEPVIVMHEWLGDHSNYDPALPYLNKDDFKWIFTDLRGYGRSKSLQGDFTCREAADDVINLVDHLDLDSLHLVGHSMSAMVAQLIASEIPKKIQSLILVTPVPASGLKVSSEVEEDLNKVIADDIATMKAINSRTGNRYNSTWLKEKLSIARKASTVDARRGYLNMFLHSDYSKEVKGLDVPVSVLAGKFDIPVFQKKHIEQLFCHWYSDLEVIECSESGHYPMLECPVFFASQLEHFILDNQNY